jgi:hypothetical protein
MHSGVHAVLLLIYRCGGSVGMAALIKRGTDFLFKPDQRTDPGT